MTMEDLIHEYLNPDTAPQDIQDGIQRRNRTLEHYRELSIEEAIERALDKTAFVDEYGVRWRETHFDHIRHDTIDNVRKPLIDLIPDLRKAESFLEIWTLINDAINVGSNHIHGVGDLFVYDVALRIALTFNKEEKLPKHVFLHRDPLISANHMGIPHPKNLPYADRQLFDQYCAKFKDMKPHEIENFLCVYNEQILKLPPK